MGGGLEIVGEEVTSPFDNAHLLAKVRARWTLSPCYMHRFVNMQTKNKKQIRDLTVHVYAV